MAATILFSFPLPVYIYIKYVFLRVTATMNLYCNFILLDKKMADLER